MTIPTKLKILGFNWKIEHRSADVIREGNIHGSTHMQTQKIFLDDEGTIQKNEQTFLHEILHAVWWQMGLNKRKGFDGQMQEEIVDALSSGLYQVLKDNRLLK